MSWDVFIQHLPASAVHVDDVPDDFVPLPLGTQADVLRAIRSVFPNVTTTDTSWAIAEHPRYRIEFGLGADDTVMSMQLHVRGDESVVPLIASLIDALGARALDSWTGDFFDVETAPESIRRWQQYVNDL